MFWITIDFCTLLYYLFLSFIHSQARMPEGEREKGRERREKERGRELMISDFLLSFPRKSLLSKCIEFFPSFALSLSLSLSSFLSPFISLTVTSKAKRVGRKFFCQLIDSQLDPLSFSFFFFFFFSLSKRLNVSVFDSTIYLWFQSKR